MVFPHHPRPMVGAVAGAVALSGALLLAVTTDGPGSGAAGDGRSGRSGVVSTAPAGAGPTGAAETASSAAPLSAPAGAAQEGSVLTATDAWLKAPPPPLVQSIEPATADCRALGDPGWAVDCGDADMAAGPRVWLVESRPAMPSTLWRAFVLEWSPAKAAWLVNLSWNNEGVAPGKSAPLDLEAITVKAEDLTGDGKAELVVGFRSQGTGGYLSYDIVTSAPGTGPSVAAARAGLTKGQVAVGGGLVTEYAAAYPAGEAQCCPAHFEKALVRWSGGSFRLLPSSVVPAPGPGRLDL